MKQLIQILLAVLFLILFGLILYLVLEKKIESFDQAIYEMISKFINPVNTKMMRFITFFGGTLGILLSVLVSYVF